MTKDEALKLALESTTKYLSECPDPSEEAVEGLCDAASAARKAIAAPVQEPVAWEDGPHLVVRSDMRERLNYKGPWVDMGRAIPDKWIPVLYTTPPAAQRQWVGLTDDEFRDFASTLDYGTGGLIRAIEAKLREKNA